MKQTDLLTRAYTWIC